MNNPTSNNLKSNPPGNGKFQNLWNLPVENLKKEILSHVGNCRQLARRTVEEAWQAGRYLDELKSRLEHGQWGTWLKQAGINQETARRFMLIAGGHRHNQIGGFLSIDEAFKALPGPDPASSARPAPKPDTFDDASPVEEMPPATELTPTEKRLIEEDQLKSTVALAGEQIADLERRVEEKDQVIQHYETGEKVSQGFIQGRDVIEARHEEIRQLKYSLNNCLEENASLKRELFGLKKALKEKDAELEKLRSERDNAAMKYDEFVSKLRADYQSTDGPENDIPGFKH